MLLARRCRMIIFWLLISLFLSAFQVSAETLYRWRNSAGVFCYSNVSPPGGIDGFATLDAAPSKDRQFQGVSSVKVPTTGPTGEEAIPSTLESRSDLLRERIAESRETLHHIETMLGSRPHDTALRHRLYEKRRCLHEDIIRLELLSKSMGGT